MSAACWTISRRMNAQTTSGTQVMLPHKGTKLTPSQGIRVPVASKPWNFRAIPDMGTIWHCCQIHGFGQDRTSRLLVGIQQHYSTSLRSVRLTSLTMSLFG